MSATPTPHPRQVDYKTAAPDHTQPDAGMVHGQSPRAAQVSAILHRCATDLWDIGTYDDPGQMWEEARAVASRILAACPAS